MDHLNRPHGGTLVDLLVDDDRRQELKEASRDWQSWDLTPRQICDIELLMNGGFSPLRGFLGKKANLNAGASILKPMNWRRSSGQVTHSYCAIRKA